MIRCILLACLFVGVVMSVRASEAPVSNDRFLEDLSKTSFTLFRDEANPRTGLVPDAVRTDGSSSSGRVASIAGTGFGLAALAIADEQGWLEHAEAIRRTRLTLHFLLDHVAQEHGFFYHFVSMETGARCWNSEVSSIDTTWLLCGALTARQQFDDPDIREQVSRLYDRVDWPWMLNGRLTLCQGWSPEDGFTHYRWEGYAEQMALYLLGLGSCAHPLPAACWTAWRREPIGVHAGYTFLEGPPLFVHQYSQAFVDFRGRRDAFANYWQNSVFATLAQRQMCVYLRHEFPRFSETLWGITSSESTNGYRAWGGPPRTVVTNVLDGTLVPCAPGGSIPFAPDICLSTLRAMRAGYGRHIWGRFGFADAFNPQTGWVAPDVLSIDAGITLLMAENQRNGFVWSRFMRNPEIQAAMTRAGFRPVVCALSARDRDYLTHLAEEAWTNLNMQVQTAGDAGLLMTAIVAAKEMALLDDAQARQETMSVLEKLSRLPESSSACEAGRLAAGLAVAGEMIPDLRTRCQEALHAIRWNRWLSESTLAASPLGGEIRLPVFLAIACGALPPSAWPLLIREIVPYHHTNVLKVQETPGGLSGACVPGLWLDERNTLMGQSAQNAVYATLADSIEQKQISWGCASQDETSRSIVAPHLVALALGGDFQSEALANLRALESDGARGSNGFAGRFNCVSRCSVCDATTEERTLFFLGVSQALEPAGVRSWFQKSDVVIKGRREIVDYAHPSQGPSNAVFTLREHQYDAPRHAVARRLPMPDAAWDWHGIDAESRESVADGDGKISMRFAFAWDVTNLVFKAEVVKPGVINNCPTPLIYKQDCVELFINPSNDGLVWWRTNDFQFGFAVTNRTWEWFGGRNLSHVQVEATTNGYVVLADIPWEKLGCSPHPGLVVGVSPALNGVSGLDEPVVLLNWRWRKQFGRLFLGDVRLEGP